jgi:hypothetical protein
MSLLRKIYKKLIHRKLACFVSFLLKCDLMYSYQFCWIRKPHVRRQIVNCKCRKSSQLADVQDTVQVYVLWLHLIFITIIPFLVLFCLNKIIYRKLSEVDQSLPDWVERSHIYPRIGLIAWGLISRGLILLVIGLTPTLYCVSSSIPWLCHMFLFLSLFFLPIGLVSCFRLSFPFLTFVSLE